MAKMNQFLVLFLLVSSISLAQSQDPSPPPPPLTPPASQPPPPPSSSPPPPPSSSPPPPPSSSPPPPPSSSPPPPPSSSPPPPPSSSPPPPPSSSPPPPPSSSPPPPPSSSPPPPPSSSPPPPPALPPPPPRTPPASSPPPPRSPPPPPHCPPCRFPYLTVNPLKITAQSGISAKISVRYSTESGVVKSGNHDLPARGKELCLTQTTIRVTTLSPFCVTFYIKRGYIYRTLKAEVSYSLAKKIACWTAQTTKCGDRLYSVDLKLVITKGKYYDVYSGKSLIGRCNY